MSQLLQHLEAALAPYAPLVTVSRGEATIEVAPQHYLACCQTLKEHAELRFDTLIDLCGVDYLGYGQGEWETDAVSSDGFSRGVGSTADNFLGSPGRFRWEERPEVDSEQSRFAVVLHLLSVVLNHRLRLRVRCGDGEFPAVGSVCELWRGANWFEREAFDLYGIVFEGHPDLRRLLTDYGFVGHPFRKDFPLIGNVEVRYDANKGRVVYEPVSIDPRVGVPRVVRDDSRYQSAQAETAAKKA